MPVTLDGNILPTPDLASPTCLISILLSIIGYLSSTIALVFLAKGYIKSRFERRFFQTLLVLHLVWITCKLLFLYTTIHWIFHWLNSWVITLLLLMLSIGQSNVFVKFRVLDPRITPTLLYSLNLMCVTVYLLGVTPMYIHLVVGGVGLPEWLKHWLDYGLTVYVAIVDLYATGGWLYINWIVNIFFKNKTKVMMAQNQTNAKVPFMLENLEDRKTNLRYLFQIETLLAITIAVGASIWAYGYYTLDVMVRYIGADFGAFSFPICAVVYYRIQILFETKEIEPLKPVYKLLSSPLTPNRGDAATIDLGK